jgi:hypothetical protein
VAIRPDEAKTYRSDFIAAARSALSRAKAPDVASDVPEPRDEDDVDAIARTDDPYTGAGMWS